MRIIKADKKIYLGRAGEVNNIQVDFDMPEEWDGVATNNNVYIAFEQAGQEMGIPLNVTIEGKIIHWVIDCPSLKVGEGKAQLTLLEDGENISDYPFVKIRKSKTYKTQVDGSLNMSRCGCGSTWMDDILALVKAWHDGNLGTLNLEFVASLPSSPKLNYIYVTHESQEYIMNMYHNNAWIVLGSSAISAPVFLVTSLPADPRPNSWYILRTIQEGGSTYKLYYYTTNTGFALIADTEGAKDYTDDQVLAEKTRAEGVEQGKVDKIQGKGLSTNDYTNADKQKVDNIASDISTAISGHNSSDSAHGSLFGGKVDKVNGKQLSTNDYTNSDKQKVDNITSDISSAITSHDGSNSAHANIRQLISDINALIMSGTTTLNKLTNQEFVNSTVSTATATFRGTFTVQQLGLTDSATNEQIVAALPSVITTADKNDYCFVSSQYLPANEKSNDGDKNTLYRRFKYVTSSWSFEYALNNTIFTAIQFAAINSGIDSTKVAQIATNSQNILALQTGKQDALTQAQLNAVNSGINSTKVSQITTNAQNISSLQTNKQDKLTAGTHINITNNTINAEIPVEDVKVNNVSVVDENNVANINLSDYTQVCSLKLVLVKDDTASTPVIGAKVTIKNTKSHTVFGEFNYTGVPLILNLPAGFEFTVCCSSVAGASAPLAQTFTAQAGEKTITMTYLTAGIVCGFKIDSENADPKASVTYLENAIGATPAVMDTTNDYFNYGSWDEAFFIPRPCMVKSDGKRDYYLDPNDYSKKLDGTQSDYNNVNYDGNVMVEFGRDGRKIWYKIVPDTDHDGTASIYISDTQKDTDYKCWSFLDMNGAEMEHFYVAAYNGSYDTNNKMRSISGMNIGHSLSGTTEIQRARANNADATKVEWSTEVFCDIQLINFLLILMGKDLNTQRAFGNGHTTGGAAATDLLNPGTMDSKGLFWGADGTVARTGVKVFGIENWWGNQWRRYEGYITDGSTQHKYKLTYSQVDGSTADDYSPAGNGYIETSIVVPNNVYQKKQSFDNGVMLCKGGGASSSTYYCDVIYSNANCYAYHGGPCGYGAVCGAFCVSLPVGVTHADWYGGASLSLKPLA